MHHNATTKRLGLGNTMNKTVLIGAAVAAVFMLLGDGFAVSLWLTGHDQRRAESAKTAQSAQTAQTAEPAPEGPVSVAELPKFVLSLPANASGSGGGYVQVAFAFSTYDPQAIEAFNKFQPIIKAKLILDLLQKSSDVASGSPPEKRQAVINGTLAIVNDVMHQEDPTLGDAPFKAAYLTDFVAQ
jgi:flagellar basal body-associated protein FliL